MEPNYHYIPTRRLDKQLGIGFDDDAYVLRVIFWHSSLACFSLGK
uniref:Uncharacterized protein n=1 Tax=Rhizophora mucronata TaxID=61149 RepID=A0A2P2PLX1_RHIMU